MKNYIKLIIVGMVVFLQTGCKDEFLDVIPDNIATIENAFNRRFAAESYLFTCYSYLPKHGNVEGDPAMLGGDELWGYASNPRGRSTPYFNHRMFSIALGNQNVVAPFGNFYWDELYKGIRDCNIFLDNIHLVPDIEEIERKKWISEVKFLKAYYHFYLMKMYGPIAIMDKSLPIDASVEEVRVSRNTVDECFNYVIELLDESIVNLPNEISNPIEELGRITKPIASALKAKVLVFHASPLFNGNEDFSALENNDGTKLFNAAYDESRWVTAANACKEAIELCEGLGYSLHVFNNTINRPISSDIETQLSVRNSITEKWNTEVIWSNSQSYARDLQALASAFVDQGDVINISVKRELAVPLKITDQFYTKNGVPMNEDNSWNYTGRYGTKVAANEDYPFISVGYETTNYNYDREQRYYAGIGFDGGVWYGQGKYDQSNLWHIETKFKQPNSDHITGNYAKKLVHFENVQSPGRQYSINSYPWPVIKLSDLYLLYTEALNESGGPSAEAYQYIDKIRTRAGLNDVQSSWATFSTNPTKPNSKEGFREIIQQERMIELVFEGQRFWDIRRWKTAPSIMNGDIQSWSTDQKTSILYSQPKTIFTQQFGLKDYFFPIKDENIINNSNLVQNLGW